MHEVQISSTDILKNDEERSSWFDNFIATISSHQLMLETNTASPELSKMYEVFMSGDNEKLAQLSRFQAQNVFVKNIIFKFYSLIGRCKGVKKLAFSFDDSKVLAWAEISDDDDETEVKIIMSEAKINAYFSNYGFSLDTTIVEECDQLPIPNHYKTIN